jgi:PAS domain S-box-containing protein
MIEDNNKTREQLLIELSMLRRENDQLQKLPAEPDQAEVVLQESERRYRELADLLPETVVEFDENCNFTFVNLNGLETFGYTRKDIETGLNVFQTIAPEDHDRAREAIHGVLLGARSSGHEYTMVKKDGTGFPAFIHASVITRDNKGAGLRAIVVDITERKRAEEALRQSEARYRRLFDDAVVGVFQSMPDGKVIAVNGAYARMFGYESPEELIAVVSDVASDLYADPTRRPSIVEMIKNAGQSLQVENVYKRKDGSTFIGNLHAWSVRGGKGELTLEGFVEDITERKQAEEALRESREQFKAMFETASIGMAQANSQTGQFLRVNQKMCEITGYSSDELLAMRVSEITHPEDRGQEREVFQDVINGKWPDYKLEKRYIRKDGEIIWVNVNRTIVRDSAGQPVHTVAAIEDITDRRRAEEQVKASLHEKEVLLKEVHHRVKNNLQVISSLLNMQTQYIHDPKDVDVFRASRDRVKSMALIHDKLYRSENLASIHFPGYVNDLVRGLFASYAMDKGVELDLRVDPISLNIDNAIPLGLIINELVSNALKHAFPEGIGGTIAIELEPQGGQMLLTISDNGIGFPEDLDFTDTQSLGMQLVVALVEQLDGTIELKRDKGTKFGITFKAAG